MMRFNEARTAAWALTMLSPFLRSEERAHRQARILSGHVRCSLKGAAKRWLFKDGSVLELMGGKHRVVTP